MEIAQRAAELVEEDFVVGLGTGRAATAFIHVLAEKVREGLHVQGVATSQASELLATQLGVPLTTLDQVPFVHLTVDGADEVDPKLNVIKGYGGALVREKIVAAASKRLVILVGGEKLVPVLGSRGTLPVEVVPFGMAVCQRRLAELSIRSRPRMVNGNYFHTDNGNLILDCDVTEIPEPERLEQQLRSIPGIVGTGLFLGMADLVIVQHPKSIAIHSRDHLPADLDSFLAE